ncbi:T-cell surface glycoprotein CD5 [Ctenodactylus gundi]
MGSQPPPRATACLLGMLDKWRDMHLQPPPRQWPSPAGCLCLASDGPEEKAQSPRSATALPSSCTSSLKRSMQIQMHLRLTRTVDRPAAARPHSEASLLATSADRGQIWLPEATRHTVLPGDRQVPRPSSGGGGNVLVRVGQAPLNGGLKRNTFHRFQVRLSGSNSRCQGQLQVHRNGTWRVLCRDIRAPSLSCRPGDPQQASRICQQLHCGDFVSLGHFASLRTPQGGAGWVTCPGALGDFSRCTPRAAGQCWPLGLVCIVALFGHPNPLRSARPPSQLTVCRCRPPERDTSTLRRARAHSLTQRVLAELPTTLPPPTTTPEPTAPPRLQLAARPGDAHCVGSVEFYSGRLGGAVAYPEAQDGMEGLGSLVCDSLRCGSLLRLLQPEAPEPGEPGARQPAAFQWMVRDPGCAELARCFRPARRGEGGRALAVVCSGFQPKVQSRLVGGSSACAGTVEVRQGPPGTRWAPLCDSPKGSAAPRWEELCREQQCGHAVSYQALDASKGARGVCCDQAQLSQCHELRERKGFCRRVRLTCHDPNPAGLAAGTVGSIVLALLLLAVLLAMCGPHAYRKLEKKFRQKKQRQWIGPTGMSQNMSFHRNHTATASSQAQSPPAPALENEYSQPPRSSRLSAYPALEGALRHSATQRDDSSDSDYDLRAAQRL